MQYQYISDQPIWHHAMTACIKGGTDCWSECYPLLISRLHRGLAAQADRRLWIFIPGQGGPFDKSLWPGKLHSEHALLGGSYWDIIADVHSQVAGQIMSKTLGIEDRIVGSVVGALVAEAAGELVTSSLLGYGCQVRKMKVVLASIWGWAWSPLPSIRSASAPPALTPSSSEAKIIVWGMFSLLSPQPEGYMYLFGHWRDPFGVQSPKLCFAFISSDHNAPFHAHAFSHIIELFPGSHFTYNLTSINSILLAQFYPIFPLQLKSCPRLIWVFIGLMHPPYWEM